VRPGPAVFRVDAESLNLPRGVKMMRINPAQVTLEMERVAHKSVPVRLRFAGRPPPDLQVADTKVSPETVQVTGPASDIEDVHAANTEPLDIRAATVGTIERELPLESLGDYVLFSANRVAAQVRLEEVSITRELKHVSIDVRKAEYSFRVVPDSLRLTVRGPKHLLSDLELDRSAVYIDADGTGVGNHMVKPTVELPAGVELVSSDPPAVRLILWKGKRTGHERR
jgi:YbbR domain-containing protein